ncbi:hypothetical protein [Propioniciclava soli]|uniref:Uncharacterized protein n=1 Tax=Propioniciclava soli TaxID=2775081 RepID=A0ABZ3C561_9ACTN|nr:hypothetical protein [Propioniciclava soli]
MDSNQPTESTEPQDPTPVEELNDEGVGGTMGADNTFEPEEDEDAPVEPS